MVRANQHRFAIFASALGLAAAALPCWAEPGAGPLEQAVKATYLVKFAPFVSWPEAASTGQLKICIQGHDPFGEVLDRAVVGQSFRGRPIAIVRMERVEPGSDCDIAYIGGSALQSEGDALTALKSAPTLSVMDSGQPHAAAAMIQLKVVDGRVRFAVDLGQAKRAGLEINSKLLALAVSVKR